MILLPKLSMPRGPVVIDIAGLELTGAERERLMHPLVGAVILFSRNYASLEQLRALTSSIAALRSPALIIAVDHEGGRVQRFRNGFSVIPPMRTLGAMWDRDVDAAAQEARMIGRTIAAELRGCGIDFSFTPVLDLDHARSGVIGDRAFHGNANAVAHLAAALVEGLHAGGMAAVGKHFPGHGYAEADSHTDVPIDTRELADILAQDVIPFGALIAAGLEAIMPAHVVYPAVDEMAAGYSTKWLQDILRGRLGFDGVIFSDDLGMVGAHGAGEMQHRADAALAAGCDVVLVCNDPTGAEGLLDTWQPPVGAKLARRWDKMQAGPRASPAVNGKSRS
ncbi:MAG: beta-N-acetylhexosaminidase [Pseudomonadota bacterium]|nr:beta-N-acetylhexosaminidase [Pseudomonadota bacterium]